MTPTDWNLQNSCQQLAANSGKNTNWKCLPLWTDNNVKELLAPWAEEELNHLHDRDSKWLWCYMIVFVKNVLADA